MTRKAVVDTNGDVQNVIVADDGYEHPEHSLMDAENRRVQPGDYHDEQADEFVTPRPTLDAPDTIVNDGQTAADVVVGSTFRDEQEIEFAVAGVTETLTVAAGGSVTETITTAAEAGTMIEITATADGQTASTRIEVVSA